MYHLHVSQSRSFAFARINSKNCHSFTAYFKPVLVFAGSICVMSKQHWPTGPAECELSFLRCIKRLTYPSFCPFFNSNPHP